VREENTLLKEAYMPNIDLSIIVAMTPERVIGNKGELPWRLPSDLKRFKELTKEVGVVIMGCATYESILHRNAHPLPDRKHIVLTRKRVVSRIDSVCLVGSVEKALVEVVANGGRACVIGGGEIYKLFLPLQQMRAMYITTVYAPGLVGDTYFPPIFGPEANMEWRSSATTAVRRWSSEDEYRTSFGIFRR
jgi:dihydrofolate reductase